MTELNSWHRRRCFSARLGLLFVLLVLIPVSPAAGQDRGVGSRGALTGPSVTNPRTGSAAAPTTGAKQGDAPLATVSLLGNDLNRCVDGADDCRVYLVALTEADPEIAYAGDAIVQRPTLLNVFMAPEDAHDLLICRTAGGRDVEWSDLVERGRTVANLQPPHLQQVFNWASGSNAVPARYRLVWCPTTGDPKPFGRSWSLRVQPKSVDPLRPPGVR